MRNTICSQSIHGRCGSQTMAGGFIDLVKYLGYFLFKPFLALYRIFRRTFRRSGPREKYERHQGAAF